MKQRLLVIVQLQQLCKGSALYVYEMILWGIWFISITHNQGFKRILNFNFPFQTSSFQIFVFLIVSLL